MIGSHHSLCTVYCACPCHMPCFHLYLQYFYLRCGSADPVRIQLSCVSRAGVALPRPASPVVRTERETVPCIRHASALLKTASVQCEHANMRIIHSTFSVFCYVAKFYYSRSKRNSV